MVASASDPALRLSAQRALLGAIHPVIRRVKVKRDGSNIVLTAVASAPLSDLECEALSIAATEIVADFPGSSVEERLIISSDPLPSEDLLSEGWVFQRAE